MFVTSQALFFWLSISSLLWIVSRIVFDPLKSIKSAPGSKIFPIWILRTLSNRKWHQSLNELHRELGDVVRIGPHEVSFSTSSAYQAIYDQPEEQFPSSGSYGAQAIHIFLGIANIFTVNNGERHQKLRKNVHSALSKVRHQENDINLHYFKELESKLDQACENGAIVDLTTLLSEMTWNIVGQRYFVTPIDLKHKRMIDYYKVFGSWLGPGLELLLLGFNTPILGVFIVALIRGFAKLTFMFNADSLNPDEAVRRFVATQDKSDNTVANYVTGYTPGNRSCQNLSQNELLINMVTLVFANYLTLSEFLPSCFGLLLREPEQMENLQRELDQNLVQAADIEENTLKQLPFLNNCIKEALRMAPTINTRFLARQSPGIEIDGVYIPRGVTISVDTYSMQRHPAYWEQPDRFLPQRWYDNLESGESHHAWRPFSSGRHACPGADYAIRVSQQVLVRLMYKYNFQLVDSGSQFEQRALSGMLWSYPKSIVKVTSRSPE